MSYYKEQLNDWVGTLNVQADFVYDVGGAQNPIKGRTNTWDVLDYKIIDLEHPHVLTQQPHIIWDVNDPLTKKLRGADAIFCLGVFDFVIDPVRVMKDLLYILTKHGTLWVDFTYIYAIHQPQHDLGVRYTPAAVRRIVKAAGGEMKQYIIKKVKPGNNHLTEFYKEEGMSLANGIDQNITGCIVRIQHGT